MIDLHVHILPGLDDGAPDWDSAVAMGRLAVDSGVYAVVATPHSGLPGQETAGRAELLRQTLAELRTRLDREGIRLAVGEGMEIFGTGETAELLRRGELLTINRSRYPLIEFPFHDYGRQATRILEQVAEEGFRPVVAHPERYRYTQSDPALLNLWTDMGCLFQVNRGSLLGRFGRGAEELGWAMVDRGFVLAVASDAHSPHARTPWMKDIYQLLREETSEEEAKRLVELGPAGIIRDEEISMPEPIWF